MLGRQENVKVCSSSVSLANCVDCATRLEIDLHLAAWWERVPSKSNLGHPPSRGIVAPLLLGWPTPCCTSAAALLDLQVRIARSVFVGRPGRGILELTILCLRRQKKVIST